MAKFRWYITDCHVVFPMLPGETTEGAEDRLIDALYKARMNPISLWNEEITESDEPPCEFCKHYDAGENSEPCVNCTKENKLFEPMEEG